jgi:hypothetical protein
VFYWDVCTCNRTHDAKQETLMKASSHPWSNEKANEKLQSSKTQCKGMDVDGESCQI